MTMLEWALKYAALGIPVFPLAPLKKTPFYGSRGHLDATTDVNKIKAWWAKYPNANIGAACGKKFVVVDADPGSEDYFTRELLTTEGPRQATPRGGPGHLFFKVPDISVVGRIGFSPKLDFRCEGNYVVMAPSKVDDGGVKGEYKWVNEELTTLPDLPEWVLKRVDAQAAPATNGKVKEKVALDEEIGDGNRNSELTSRVGKLIKRGHPYEEVLVLSKGLNKEVCIPPLHNNEVEKIVKSIWKREVEKGNIKGVKAFEIKSWSQMLRLYADKEESFLIEDWWPDATCGLITAAPGMFKTWLTTELALCVARGKDFLGRYRTNDSGPVLIIQQEDPFGMLIERMMQVMNVGQGHEWEDKVWEVPQTPRNVPIEWHTNREFRFDNDDIVKALITRIKEKRYRLVVLDPLYSAGDTEDYMAKTARQMLMFKNLRDEIGTSFAVVHHSLKKVEGSGRARDSAWGSQFLNAWQETGWQCVESDADANITVHRNFKSKGQLPPVDINFSIQPGKFQATIVEADFVPDDNSTIEKVKRMIQTGNISTITQVMEIVGLKSKNSVHRILNKIGAVKKGGKYVLLDIKMED